ncbi:MAG: FGGY-family carbohydrate kinase [Pelolinea sp.]|nr:FGGY-family carbohydrate kinase [Pelolinea sp.]
MGWLFLGIDIGSYSSKGVLCTTYGEIVAEARIPHEISIPKPGYAEHDADKVWWADFVTIANALTAKVPPGEKIAAVGVSGVGACVLPVDRNGKPLRPAILYGIDTRTTSQIEYLENIYSREELTVFGGARLTSQSAGPKILWIKQNEPGIYRLAEKFVTSTTYIIHMLTGHYVIDRHVASYFNPLLNIQSLDWDKKFADEIVELDRLPELGWSDEIAGNIHAVAAKETGILEGTPVTFGALDGLAEGISAGVVNPGELMIMYGSTAGFYLPIEKPLPTNELWIVAGALKGQYAYAGGLATSGTATTWFRDQFGLDLLGKEAKNGQNAYAALAASAAYSPPGAKGLLMLPFLSGERTPLFDTKARGVFAGLTLSHTRGDMYRALLEGTAYAIRSNLDAMRKAGAEIDHVIAVGGGASNDLWLQIVSDVSGIPQIVPEKTIGACYGDAFLAGLAVGTVGGLEALKRDWVKISKEIIPDAGKKARYDQFYQLFRDLYTQSKEVIHRLADLQG